MDNYNCYLKALDKTVQHDCQLFLFNKKADSRLIPQSTVISDMFRPAQELCRGNWISVRQKCKQSFIPVPQLAGDWGCVAPQNKPPFHLSGARKNTKCLLDNYIYAWKLYQPIDIE